jgi:hypothetical protein
MHPNEWFPGMDEFSCGKAQELKNPRMGFAKAWCEKSGLMEALGLPTGTEEEFSHQKCSFQRFRLGFVFEDAQGKLRAFKDNPPTWSE